MYIDKEIIKFVSPTLSFDFLQLWKDLVKRDFYDFYLHGDFVLGI